MNEKNYKIEGKIAFQPRNITPYNNQNKFSFKLEGNEDWFAFYQQDGVSDEEFKKIMDDDFKKGFGIKFNEIQTIVTDYVVTDRTESQKKAYGGGFGPKETFEERAAGFSVSYAKDLIIADKATLESIETLSERIFNQVVKLGKKK